MRYELKRNSKGMITQCDTNADGGNIYARREEINKLAIENLARPTPGKLGNLSNLQLFNFSISNFSADTSASFFYGSYNTTVSFPANATQVVMFGVDGLNNKALYYNVLDVKADLNGGSNDSLELLPDSYISFYLLQNIETSTTSLGTKIPQPAPLYGNGGGSVDFTTTGDIQGHQSITTNFLSDSVVVPSNTKGLRASGIALKDIVLKFGANENLSVMSIDVQVYVDVNSVSSTY